MPQEAARELEVVVPDEVVGDGQPVVPDGPGVDQHRDEGRRPHRERAGLRRARQGAGRGSGPRAGSVHRALAAVVPDDAAAQERDGPRVGSPRLEERLERTGQGDRVVVHEPDQVRVHRLDGVRYPGREAARAARVARHLQDGRADGVLTGDDGGVVVRAVVHHEHRVDGTRLPREGVERLDEQVAPVVRHDHRDHPGLGGHSTRSRHDEQATGPRPGSSAAPGRRAVRLHKSSTTRAPRGRRAVAGAAYARLP